MTDQHNPGIGYARLWAYHDWEKANGYDYAMRNRFTEGEFDSDDRVRKHLDRANEGMARRGVSRISAHGNGWNESEAALRTEQVRIRHG